MEEHFRAKKEKEEEERKKLHAESLAAVKKKALKTAEDNKMESYAERLARLGRDNLWYEFVRSTVYMICEDKRVWYGMGGKNIIEQHHTELIKDMESDRMDSL